MKSTCKNVIIQLRFTLLIAFWDLISGFPSGAPGNSCLDPAPYHFRRLNATHTGFYYPQPMASNPYTLTTSSSRYVNGMMLRVTLQAPPGENFRGFFIHALPDNQRLDAPDRPTYGTFVPAQNSQNSQPRSCRSLVGMVGGITHTNNENKTEVAVDWIPPLDCNLGPVQFVATVVKEYAQYWVDVRSPTVQPSGYPERRDILCQLYVQPYNVGLQERVLDLLRRMRMRRLLQRQNGRRVLERRRTFGFPRSMTEPLRLRGLPRSLDTLPVA